MLRIAIVIFLVFSYLPAFAECPAGVGSSPKVFTCVDTSEAEVTDCIDDAVAAGESAMVVIPAGSSAAYTGTVQYLVTNDLTIRGAGETTVITSGDADRVWILGADTGATITIENLKIVGGAYSYSTGIVSSSGNGTKIWRHLTVDGTSITGGKTMWMIGDALIHNCDYTIGGNGQGISIWGTAEPGDYNYWYGDTDFGSANFTFVEDCTFSFPTADADGAFDAYYGARLVFRHNTVIGTIIGWHGNDSGAGLHSAEVYSNTLLDPSNQSVGTLTSRGGTALIWGNTIDANLPQGFMLSHYRSCPSLYDAGQLGLDAVGCDNTGDAGAAHDGNLDVTGWPCYQSPGTTGTDGVTIYPSIEWGNDWGEGSNNMGFYLNPSLLDPTCDSTWDMSDHFKEERDYLNHDTCSDEVDNDGDGLTDMADPQCSGFWDSVGAQAKNYTPYQYPHPLRGSPKRTTTSGKNCTTDGKGWVVAQ